MTIRKLRDLISGQTMVQDNVIFTILRADDDFRYDVAIAYSLTERGLLHIQGFCSKLKVSSDRVSDAIIYCNNHNKNKYFPAAYYHMEDRDFNLSWAMDTENTTEECIRHHIELIVPTIWHFFVEVGKEF